MAQAKIFLLLALIITKNLYAYDAAIKVDLVGNRELIIIPDNFERYSEERKQLHAISLIHAIRLLAIMYPEQIVFSYQNPGSYGADSWLTKPAYKPLMPNDQMLAMVAPVCGLPHFEELLVPRPAHLSTFLTFDLPMAIVSLPETFWLKNLTISSNDPRQEHLSSLIKDQSWLLQHQNTLRLRDLITPSRALQIKRKFFAIDSELKLSSQRLILERIQAFTKLEEEHLRIFASFASKKSHKLLEVSELEKTIGALLPKVSLDTVYQFLKFANDVEDIYADGPIIDILLTLFDQKHPHKMVVVLDKVMAVRLSKILVAMGVVVVLENINDIIVYIVNRVAKAV